MDITRLKHFIDGQSSATTIKHTGKRVAMAMVRLIAAHHVGSDR
jgi:hypothetical protein